MCLDAPVNTATGGARTFRLTSLTRHTFLTMSAIVRSTPFHQVTILTRSVTLKIVTKTSQLVACKTLATSGYTVPVHANLAIKTTYVSGTPRGKRASSFLTPPHSFVVFGSSLRRADSTESTGSYLCFAVLCLLAYPTFKSTLCEFKA